MKSARLIRRSLAEFEEGLHIVREASSIFRKRPTLLLLPITSCVVTLGLSFYLLFVWPNLNRFVAWTAQATPLDGDEAELLGIYFAIFVALSAVSLVVFLCNTYLIYATERMIYGKRVRFSEGVVVVLDHLPHVLVYALLTGSVGAIIAIVDHSLDIDIGKYLLGTGYTVMTFFALPAAVLDDHSPISMFTVSVDLVTSRFKDTIRMTMGTFGLGVVLLNVAMGLLILPVLLVQITRWRIFGQLIAWLTFSPDGLVVSGAFICLGISALIVSMNVGAVAKTILYLDFDGEGHTRPANQSDLVDETFYEVIYDLNEPSPKT